MSQLIGSAEVAELLGLDRSRVNRLARQGRLPEVDKMAGKTGARLFDKDAILRLREESTTVTTTVTRVVIPSAAADFVPTQAPDYDDVTS